MAELDEIFREFALAFLGRVKLDKEVAFPSKLRRDQLDGTHDSLKHVDTYLSYLHAHRKAIKTEEWHTTVLWAGAYVGEVIRHETEGAFRWVDYNEYMPAHPKLQPLLPERTTSTCAFIVLSDDYMSMPLNKIARYIEEGDENNTHFFATCDISRARGGGGPTRR